MSSFTLPAFVAASLSPPCEKSFLYESIPTPPFPSPAFVVAASLLPSGFYLSTAQLRPLSPTGIYFLLLLLLLAPTGFSLRLRALSSPTGSIVGFGLIPLSPSATAISLFRLRHTPLLFSLSDSRLGSSEQVIAQTKRLCKFDHFSFSTLLTFRTFLFFPLFEITNF